VPSVWTEGRRTLILTPQPRSYLLGLAPPTDVMRFALVFSLIIAVLAVVFALQNPQTMEVNLLFVDTQGSTALVLIITFGLGVLVGLLSTLPGRIRDRRKIKSLEKSLQKVQDASFSSPSSSSSSPSASE